MNDFIISFCIFYEYCSYFETDAIACVKTGGITQYGIRSMEYVMSINIYLSEMVHVITSFCTELASLDATVRPLYVLLV